MNKKYLYIFFIFTIHSSFILPTPTIEIKKFYVSLQGNDLNDGSIRHPFASLEFAQIAVRKARKAKPNVPIEVIVKSGVYYMKKTLEFFPEDGGSSIAPVTWRAALGEKVILSGGKRIIGKWKKNKEGIWNISIPETKGWKKNMQISETYIQKPNMPWNFRSLFVNGKSAIRARFPNINSSNQFVYAISSKGNEVALDKGIIKKSWGEATDAIINIVPKWRFFNQWNDVLGVDSIKSIIKLGPRENQGEINKGSWFWIEGVKDELDMPGEWHLDHAEGILFYKPLKNEIPDSVEIIAPFLNRIFYLKGDVEKDSYVSNISFQGFHFQHTTFTLGQIESRVHTDCAVMFENTQNCSIINSHFENIGGYALWLHLNSRNNIFDNNTVKNSGAGGVLLTGARFSYMDDSKIYTPGEKASQVFPILNRITRNTVEYCGKIRYYGGGVHIDSRPASMAMEPGNYIAHNYFSHLSRNGIFAFRNQGGNVVAYNEIHDCMQTTIDGAAIHFATMNRLAAPNFILNNYLYDIWGFEQFPNRLPIRTLANGIFLDWATSNTTLKNNVIYNSGEKEIKTIMGNWNLVQENNIISKTKITPSFYKEIGPNGLINNEINLFQLKNIGGVVISSDKEAINYVGNWEVKQITGMRNLFNYKCKQASPLALAEVTYQLPIKEPGNYKVCLMYFPDQNSASNAKIIIDHANGVEKLEWNFKNGDNLGFAINIGEFYFEKGKPASLKISNQGANGYIIADGVGVIKVK